MSQVYNDLLQRPVDTSGLSFWTGQLSQGASRQQVATSIENSGEFRAIEVRNLYTQYLLRSPDAGGLAFWTSQLANGTTLEQVAAGFVGSAEYKQTRGGGTVNGFLTALYHDALGRTPDATGQAGFSAALQAGATTGQVAAIVFGSGEFLKDDVQGFYQTFLHRSADNGGLSFFVNALQQGATDQQVIAVIVGSDEYFNRL